MRIIVRSARLSRAPAEAHAVAAFEGKKHPSRVSPYSFAQDRAFMKLVNGSGFRGGENDTVLLPRGRQWVLLVGLGKREDLSLEHARRFAATAARSVRDRGFRSMALPILGETALRSVAEEAQALTEGLELGLYRYDRFKSASPEERAKRLNTVFLMVERAGDVSAAARGVSKGRFIAEGVSLARDLINGPSNVITPIALASAARRIAAGFSHLSARTIPYARLRQAGFGGIVGVAQGSSHPAQFIILDYSPPRAKHTFVFCGKGVTFDTGGINLKPSAKMEEMKYDMSGAAAVLGTIRVVAKLRLPARVVGLIAATENMPSGSAQKPGDIQKTLSGKSVEVLNTDAEGRLVLADCLHYAKRYKPDCVVDLATLTGACIVALGSEAVGLMTRSDRLAKRLTEAGKATHERLWRLPLWDEYAKLMKSDIADVKNVSNTSEAGTITAAAFLETFAEGLPWAHLDIAGTAWSNKDKPYVPKGAVGIGVRLLVELIEKWK